jgi:hypothetical protein
MRSLSKPFILFLHISTIHPGRSYHGSPDYSCEYCSAIFWYGERLQRQSSLSQHRVVYSGCYARGSVSLHIHGWHVSHNMHGKMQWTTMNSTGVDMCFVIVLNQRPESSSSIKLLALQHVHDQLFHAFRRWAIGCHSCVPQRRPSHASKPTNGRDSLYWYGAPRFTQMWFHVPSICIAQRVRKNVVSTYRLNRCLTDFRYMVYGSNF